MRIHGTPDCGLLVHFREIWTWLVIWVWLMLLPHHRHCNAHGSVSFDVPHEKGPQWQMIWKVLNHSRQAQTIASSFRIPQVWCSENSVIIFVRKSAGFHLKVDNSLSEQRRHRTSTHNTDLQRDGPTSSIQIGFINYPGKVCE